MALDVDPTNEKLQQRAKEVKQLRSETKPTVPSTFGLERQINPFLRPSSPAIRQSLGMEQSSDLDVFAHLRKKRDVL